jgi:hypothetical protein
MERTNASGEPSESPPDYLEINAADGVVEGRVFVERTNPPPCMPVNRSGKRTGGRTSSRQL